MSTLIDTIIPVFSIVALGWWLAARGQASGSHASRNPLDLKMLADLVMLVASPALMFSVLASAEVNLGRWGNLVGGTLWIVAGTAIPAAFYAWTAGEGRRCLLLPAMFWNAGNLTLPLARLAFGPSGLEAAAVIFVTMSILTSTIGIWIAKGENGLSEMLRMPLVYASVGGFLLALSGTTLPRFVMAPIEMLGAMAIPLMLLNLGMQLRTLELSELKHSIVVVGIRVMGGGACALLFVTLFGVWGVERQVLLLASIMPAAVINVLMAQRYSSDPSLVASAVTLGTLVSLVTIPAVLYFLSIAAP